VNSLRVKGIIPLWNTELLWDLPASHKPERCGTDVGVALYGLLEIQFHFIHVAPSPSLAALDGAHDRVLGLMEMLRRVLAD